MRVAGASALIGAAMYAGWDVADTYSADGTASPRSICGRLLGFMLSPVYGYPALRDDQSSCDDKTANSYRIPYRNRNGGRAGYYRRTQCNGDNPGR